MGGSAWVCPFNDKKDERPRAGSSTREHAAHGGGPPSPRSPLPTLSLSGPKRRSPAAGCNLRFIAVTPLTLLRCPPRSFPPLAPFPPFPPLRPSHPLSSPSYMFSLTPSPPARLSPARLLCDPVLHRTPYRTTLTYNTTRRRFAMPGKLTIGVVVCTYVHSVRVFPLLPYPKPPASRSLTIAPVPHRIPPSSPCS